MTLRRSVMVTAFLGMFIYANFTPAFTTASAKKFETSKENLFGSGRPEQGIQPLYEFINSVKTGQAGVLAGVYVAGLFAFPVVQQPAGDAAFVASLPDTLTQFKMASGFGTTGILAHNTLAGAYFSSLQPRQKVTLVFGNGSISEYVVNSIRRFQALSPSDPFSNFMDLEHPGQVITSSQLFETIYATSQRQVVFQTCIASGFDASWGRLFITAAPAARADQVPASIRFIQ